MTISIFTILGIILLWFIFNKSGGGDDKQDKGNDKELEVINQDNTSQINTPKAEVIEQRNVKKSEFWGLSLQLVLLTIVVIFTIIGIIQIIERYNDTSLGSNKIGEVSQLQEPTTFHNKLNEPTEQKNHLEVENLEQGTYQTFASAGFRVKCNCNLFLNTTFMKMAKQQGVNNIIAAYACAENEDDPAIGVIININIYDVSEDYKAIPESEYSRLAEMVLKQYASQLSNSGITDNYTYTTYQGVQALEYTFDQMGLPTKAIIFHKNKKSYLLQVGTRNNLAAKYTSLKNNFEVI